MNKMKKLLSVVLAVVLAFSAFSVLGSAAKTAYKTVDELTALDAYSPYGQVTRLSLEERTSIVFDALDNLLGKANINLGEIFSINLIVTTLDLSVDLRSVDKLCVTLDDAKDLLDNGLVSTAMAIVNLGILESLNLDSWATGMSRDATANFTILSEVLEVLSNNTTLVNKVFTDGLDLGIVSLGDMSAIEDIIMNLPGMIKGLVYPMLERWDDPVSLIKTYDNSINDESISIEGIANTRVKKLFSDNMSITTLKYDANGNMTSEHTNWLATATGSAAPTASDNSLRYYYQIVNGTTMYSYHIVDAAEAKVLAEDGDDSNNVAAYNYIQENQVYRLEQEVPGSETYVWKAYEIDAEGNVVKDGNGEDKYLGTLKYYNDNSPFLPGFSGDDFDLQTMSLADLLYTFIPDVFAQMAPVVLNGSVKKILADFLGASFNYVGDVGSDEVNALADSTNTFFTEEQGEYLWEWSNYAVINGTHYYRFEDQIFVGDISQKNNYFDIINWDYEITDDFLNEFVPTNPSTTSTLLMNFNNFLVKVAELALKPSASTVDAISGFEAEWTRPAMTKGDNSNLVANLKAVAQAVIGLAPQHVFGDDYATNERCYVELMLDSDNDTVLMGIAAHLVNMIMPSVSLPGKSDLKASNAKVGAILAAVVREFAAYLAPEYDFDALIYTDFGTTTNDNVKTFVDPTSLLTSGQTASGYWFDVILTMGINVGFEYLRAFADMGEGTTEWNNFVSYSGYGVDGKTYAAGTTQAALNAEWEGMVDYILDWALTTDKEWCWAMSNLVDVDGTIDLSTAQDPWAKLDAVLNALLPVDEILNVSATDCETELEQLLRYDLILAIVDLRWDDLLGLLEVPDGFVRNDNVLDQLAGKLKGIINYLFKKLGGGSYEFIPSAITDFDSLAKQSNLVTMVTNLVGVLHTGLVTNGGCRTVFPFLNFLLGWKTDPQKIADPVIWTDFRNGNDYAYLYDNNLANQVQPGGAINGDGLNFTKIKVLNNSAGMLETHRNSSVTDHAYDIQIKSITSDATTNTLTFTYGDGNGLVSPYETLDIIIGGTYNGEEATTVTIAYDYVGKDGTAIGGTQYTSLTFLVSNQYEDSLVDGRWDGDDDDDYTGTNQYKKYVFTEDLYTSVTTYEPTIFYVKPSINLGATSKDFTQICANGEQQDCNGNITNAGDVMTAPASDYFEWIRDQQEAGWEDSISDGNPASGRLYKAKDGVTADTEFPYGSYDMGNMAVQYGGTMVYEVNFIYYNDYNIGDIYAENKDNGYNANQGVAADIYNEYNEAWKLIVYGATYPMMTEMNGHSSTDYVTAIQPYIPDAIDRFEAAKEAYETALAEAQANASGDASSSLPAYVTALRQEIDNDFMNEKEINFQDYEFYEYFNYNDVKVAAENLYRTYIAPEVLDTYHIFRSGIREAELNFVIEGEDNATKAEAIKASRRVHDQAAIDASIAARDEWQQPINTKLVVDDMTSRLAFYKQFLSEANREGNDHLKFLEREIAHVEAQQLIEADYTAASWEAYADALAVAKAVAAGEDEFSSFNSRIYDAKYNLMVAYKNLLAKEYSLIEAGGTADLLANIAIAEEILAMNMDDIVLSEAGLALAENAEDAKAKALGHLIEGLGYYYQARYSKHDVEVQDGEKTAGELKYNDDGTPMMFNLYDNSAYEYADNDRPNNQNNQAKVNAANTNLEACIAYFATAEEPSEPNTLVLNENAPFEAIIDYTNCGDYTGTIYGFDTVGINADMIPDGTIAEFVSTAYGDEYLEVVVGDSGMETTGTIINVLDEDGNVVESYVYILFGDMDMDGWVGGSDAYVAEYYEMNLEGIEDVLVFMSGDVDGDAWVGGSDAYMMEYFEMNLDGMPSQAEIGATNVNNYYELI